MSKHYKLKMKLDQKTLKDFDIIIEKDYVANLYEDKIQEIVRNTNLPGFRNYSNKKSSDKDLITKEKHKYKILEGRYGASCYEEVSKKIIQDIIKTIVEDKSLHLTKSPTLDIKNNILNQDIDVNVILECYSDFEFPDLKKCSLENTVLKIQDKDIEDSLIKKAENNKEYNDKKDGSKAIKGDLVVIDFKGLINKKPFDGGAAKDYKLILGSNSMIPGFEDQIIGKKLGDKFVIKVTFPQDYHAKNLSGKDTEFEINIKGLQNGTVPKIDDKFAVKMGAKDLKDLKVKIKSFMESNYAEQSFTILKKRLFDFLESDLDFEIPKSLYDEEYNKIVSGFSKDKGLIELVKDKPEKQVEKLYNLIVSRRLRIGILIESWSRKHNIEVGQDEILSVISKGVKSMPGQEKRVFDFYKNNPQAIQDLGAQLLENKVVKNMLSQIVKKDTTLSKKDFDEFVKSFNDDASLLKKYAKLIDSCKD